MFKRPRQLSLSCVKLTRYTPSHPTSLRSILLLYSHLHLGLSSDLQLISRPKLCMHFSSFQSLPCQSRPSWCALKLWLETVNFLCVCLWSELLPASSRTWVFLVVVFTFSPNKLALSNTPKVSEIFTVEVVIHYICEHVRFDPSDPVLL